LPAIAPTCSRLIAAEFVRSTFMHTHSFASLSWTARVLLAALPTLLLAGAVGDGRALAQANAPLGVNSTLDAPDSQPGDGLCATSAGACTLRAAIMEANARSGPDKIVLPASGFPYTLTRVGIDENGLRGDLDITGDLEIVGGGAPTTLIDGNGDLTKDRVLELHPDAEVSITGLTITNGYINAIAGGTIPYSGGGVYVADTAALTLTESAVVANRTRGSLALPDTSGAGIFVAEEGALVVLRSTIGWNVRTTRGGSGGGIASMGTARVEASRIVGNDAGDGSGGGIFNLGTLTLKNTSVENNSASSGGGFYNAGTLAIYGGLVAENYAYLGAGGYNVSSLTVVNSTLSGNRASGKGGGLYNTTASGGRVGFATLRGATVAQNLGGRYDNPDSAAGGIYNSNAANVRLKGTLLADNFLDPPFFQVRADCAGPIQSEGYNLVRSSDGCTISGELAGNLIGVDPLLRPLIDNGGPTRTNALGSGSPAVDAGDPTGCAYDPTQALSFDQRGFGRPTDGDGDGQGRCDIGAFEFGARAPIILTPTTPNTLTPVTLTPETTGTPQPSASATASPSPSASPTAAPGGPGNSPQGERYLPLITR
jgi:CSLREA domain-containing protein